MLDKFHANTAENIEKHGQALIGVLSSPPFIYTIGNAVRGLPELLLIGPPRLELSGQALNALNELGEKMRRDGKPLAEGLVDIEWSFPFKVRKAGPRAKDDYTNLAGQYLGREDYEVLQVMICDKEGRYPGDPGCAPALNVDQP